MLLGLKFISGFVCCLSCPHVGCRFLLLRSAASLMTRSFCTGRVSRQGRALDMIEGKTSPQQPPPVWIVELWMTYHVCCCLAPDCSFCRLTEFQMYESLQRGFRQTTYWILMQFAAVIVYFLFIWEGQCKLMSISNSNANKPDSSQRLISICCPCIWCLQMTNAALLHPLKEGCESVLYSGEL